MSTAPNNTLQPYLYFNGRCDEAIEFYRATVGAEVNMLLRFKDCPEGGCAPENGEKVMHANIRIGDTTVLLSDGRCSGSLAFEGFSLALIVPTEAEAEERFGALSDGGKVQMPLTKTFFSARFGMVEDKFGVDWLVLVRGAE